MSPGSANPVVFIVGCPRSGTTLLERLVDAHPAIAITHETRWIPDVFERRSGLTPDGRVTPALVPRLVAHKRFAELDIEPGELEPLLGPGPVGYAEFVSRVFDLYARRRGKELAGDKTPRYARKVATLHALFPRARFVHLIRDGRDVSLSARSWISAGMASRYPTWNEQPVVSSALWWERNVLLAREAGEPLGPDLYRELRYEALVAEPERELRALCAYLELPYDGAMLRFHEAKARWRPVTRGLRDWRAQMPAAELELFEAAAGDLLVELGYARATSPAPAAVREAASVRERFAQAVLARGRRLPTRR